MSKPVWTLPSVAEMRSPVRRAREPAGLVILMSLIFQWSWSVSETASAAPPPFRTGRAPVP